MRPSILFVSLLALGVPSLAGAQNPPPQTPRAAAPPSAVSEMLDYRIGPGDVLAVLFWRDKELSGEVVVRPDGLITLPVLNEMQAAGLSTEELRARVAERAAKFLSEPPIVSVVVRQIHSRSVYITGRVMKPGAYPLSGPLTVVQLLALAGGLGEYANKDRIVILRTENDRQMRFVFNYDDIANGRSPQSLNQNILLRPGDSVIVP